MSKTIARLNNKFFEIRLNDLYKTREDNSLTTDELVNKYSQRILEGSIPSIELSGWEVKAEEFISQLKDVNQQIKEINDLFRNTTV